MDLQLVANEPAALLCENTRRVLILADLHLGYEQVLFKGKVHTPNLSEIITQQLEQLVSEVDPTEIVILGDVKHSVKGLSRNELHGVIHLFQRLQQAATITVVRGNHDADIDLILPDDINLVPATGMTLKFHNQVVYLLHGHAIPTVELLESNSLIMAHIHPKVAIPSMGNRFSTHPVWVRTRWNPTIANAVSKWFGPKGENLTASEQRQLLEMQILILPGFLDLLPGLILNRKEEENQKRGPILPYLNMEEADLFLLNHAPLGKLNQLPFQD